MAESKLRRFVNKTKELFNTTPLEIAAGGLIFGAIGATIGHSIESNRDKLVPVAFSEISQIEDTARKRNDSVDPFTEYYAGTNDLVMKVLESWNDAWRFSSSKNEAYERFAKILDERMQEEGIYGTYRHSLKDLLQEVPASASRALNELDEFRRAKDRVHHVKRHFANAWDESHIDNYSTEIRTRQTTDANGNASMELYTEEVYDDTTHTYTYHPEEGRAAAQTLHDTIRAFESLSLQLDMGLAEFVQTENFEAIRTSREITSKEAELEDKEYLEMANTWNHGSNLQSRKKTFENPWKELRKDEKAWADAVQTAHSHKYNTASSSDAGPLEFRIAATALRNGKSFTDDVNSVMKGMEYVRDEIPELEERINDFITSTLYANGEERRHPKKAAYEIKELATTMYLKNFEGGFDVERYRTGMVVLYGVLGLFAGAAMGFAVDRIADKKKLWEDNGIENRISNS